MSYTHVTRVFETAHIWPIETNPASIRIGLSSITQNTLLIQRRWNSPAKSNPVQSGTWHNPVRVRFCRETSSKKTIPNVWIKMTVVWIDLDPYWSVLTLNARSNPDAIRQSSLSRQDWFKLASLGVPKRTKGGKKSFMEGLEKRIDFWMDF